MIYFLALFAGIILVFLGLLMSFRALNAIKHSLKSFYELQKDTKYLNLASLRQELDELNYSYYEILNDTSLRLDAIESILNRNRESSLEATQNSVIVMDSTFVREKTEEFSFLNNATGSNHIKPEIQKRMLIRKMISEGMSDQEIAKALTIGVGEVGVLRRTEFLDQ